MSEAAITSALRSLRIKTVREGRPGLEQIEALMALRGDPIKPIPRTFTVRFGRRELSRLVLEAVRERPRRLPEVADYVHARRPAMDREVVYQRVSVILSRLKAKGLVAWRDGVWRG